jgi:hypothetical protein
MFRKQLALTPRHDSHAAHMSVMIAYTSADGEEREEQWPSIERFRNWAIAERLACSFTAYEADEDGEWVVIDKGRVQVTR